MNDVRRYFVDEKHNLKMSHDDRDQLNGVRTSDEANFTVRVICTGFIEGYSILRATWLSKSKESSKSPQ